MLKVILGTDWKANSDKLLQYIAEDVLHKRSGRILVVPESISHDAERTLCSCAGDTASRYAEVLSFSRLPDRLRDTIGCAEAGCMDKGGRVVAMAAAAVQLHSKLKAYASVETRPEFLINLIEAVDEFKCCCIKPADLMKASSHAEGSLAQKLEELSLLLETYDAICAHGKRDPRDQLSWLLEQLEDCSFAADHVFYFDGFTDFTGQQLAIVKHLIECSASVTISLNCDEALSRDPAFEKAGETAAVLLRYADELGVPAEIETVKTANDTLSYVRKRLFKGVISDQPGVNACVRLYHTESVTDECDAVAQLISDRIRSGERYRDMRVVCSDISTYTSALRDSFVRFGVPMYLSGTEDILDMPIINTVVAALEAAVCGFEQKDILRYLESYLSPLDIDTCDRVENYVYMWNIRGNRWKREWVYHPDGLGKEENEASINKLKLLETARCSAITPLIRLEESFHIAGTLGEQVKALYQFFEDIALAERLDKVAANGDQAMIQIFGQLWEILVNALEQLYDVLGNSCWEPDHFVRLLKLLLSQYDVGTIPTVLDAVAVGSVASMRHQREKHLFVIGVSDGSFPSYTKSGSVLTDLERSAIRRMGIPLTGGALDGLQSEFADIYNIFCGATASVTVSCPAGQPSYIYKRLLSMVGHEKPVSIGLGAAECNPYIASAVLVRNSDIKRAERLNITDNFDMLSKAVRYQLGSVSKEGIRALYGDCLNLSASKIDKFATCRLKYFLEYGIKAKERKEATIDPSEFGSYVHDVLENTARKIKDLGGFHVVSLEDSLKIADQYAKAYAQERFDQLDSERLNYLFERNTSELEIIVKELWEELSNSDFEPYDFEFCFGPDGKMDYIHLNGKELQARLEGKVDRIDTWQNGDHIYFRVVDYKTGKKAFDYCDVFNGIGLQMFLYLFALEENGEELLGDNAVPAGVQYFPARFPIITLDGVTSDDEIEVKRTKELKRQGLILKEDHVLRAMEPCDKPLRMHYTRNKDGTIKGHLATREQMKLLKAYIFMLLRGFVDDIASGCIDPNPYTRGSNKNPCDYCPYHEICHSEYVKDRRNFMTMTDKWFWEAVGEELNRNG